MSYLGVIAAASVDHGATADVTQLVLTTTVDVPPYVGGGVKLLMVLMKAPYSQFGHGLATGVDPGLITDDSGGANVWEIPSARSNPDRAYEFGVPADITPTFDFGAFEETWNVGSFVEPLTCLPTLLMPAGTQITVPCDGTGIDGGDGQYISAVILAFDNAGDVETELAGRTIDPADQHTGASNTGTALGSHIFSAFFPAGQTFIAVAAAANDPTTGAETVDDTSGQWTKVAQDGSTDCMGDATGVTWAAFVCDGDSIDPTVGIAGGFRESVNGVATQGAVLVMSLAPLITPGFGNPCFNRVIPA